MLKANPSSTNNKQHYIGCGFLACLVIVIVNLADYFNSPMPKSDSLIVAFAFGLPWVWLAILKLKDAKEIKKVLDTQEAKGEILMDFFEQEKLILFKYLLSTEQSAGDLITREKFELDINSARQLLESEASSYEKMLELELINLCGAVALKKKLFKDNAVDLSIIDEAIKQLEEDLPISTSDLINDVNQMNYQTRKEEKYAIESKLNDLNTFYERQNQEANEILAFGCRNVSSLNFEQETKRINNLQYYPEYNLDIPFNIEEFEQRYTAFDKTAFDFYNTRVLKNSIYPSFIAKDFELNYKDDSKVLIVDYCLPNLEDVPSIKQINKQLNEINLKEKEINKLYEDILYQITLRTVYELFYNDKIDAVDSVVFNGWLNYIDKADGNDRTSCILSMQAKKDEFMSVALANVEPVACFKKFKGISCRNLSTITPIRPILTVNRLDKRFIESYEVMAKLNEGENLAMMDWKDFENLVREIFEKEFSSNGGVVKITQSSHDGGVDAIGFDPDPIRGGKIVIQAKRYTNVVGVSAVRDLYGTVQHEGAIKGILVTTSHFGMDSYEFAKDKPITLLEGSNLLHLMEKHGHKARIDIQEARMMRDN